ncbi:SNF2 helicase associated domain-containing protein [Candidatus Contubernalis alkaliaceticus]|uniref:SNF2 helicase associated domain-containing protein n=1 Tax=Candidatus Contubernalis alkaliaceticus TaxID=338645 RepID=UPI001F4C31CC|nr:SNF2 helicase associated domain-containing protein [Candidatus Contubernalis alkalaceticus]UNC91027.1 SNF2 helicase associated domain-containing protein [Candidatus Contubernalis alkalaceticus]
MLTLTEGVIKSLCYNNNTFFRGKNYYDSGYLKELFYNPEEKSFTALVRGKRSDYSVYVLFDPDGHFLDADCECIAYYNYPGNCKHITAVLLQILNNQDTYLSPELKDKGIVDFIFNYFKDRDSIQGRKELTLEYEYIYQQIESRYQDIFVSSLQLKVGENRSYKVKYISEFLKAVKEKTSIKFGKLFTYDPYVHTFKKEDTPIIDLLLEILDIDQVTAYTSYNSAGRNIIAGSKMYLPQSYAKRVLGNLINRTLKVTIFNQSFDNVKVLNEPLPLNFNLRKAEEGLLLELDNKKNLISLTTDGTFFLFDEKIYTLTQEQSSSFLPFYSGYIQNSGKPILVPMEYRERFASESISRIRKFGNILIEKELEADLHQEPLQVKVFLDMKGKDITARLDYVYGSRVINPLKEEPNNSDREILIREIEKEKKVMSSFNKAGFDMREHMFCLDGENDKKVYDFVYHALPEIQKDSSIFYSETFKRLKVKNNTRFKGRMGINNSFNLLEFEFQLEGIDQGELPDIYSSLQEKKTFHRLKDGSFLPLESEDLDKMAEVFQGLQLKKSDLKKETITLPKHQALYLNHFEQEGKLTLFKKDQDYKELIRSIKDPGHLDFKLPGPLDNVLRDYQKTGFQWLKTLAVHGFGGILADDMGLGKTLQALAFICSETIAKHDPVLIIAPTSLIFNWEAEINKFTPELKAAVISGNKKERIEGLKQAEKYQVIITSYPLIRRDIDSYKEMKFSYCILDEAQNIKNPNSQTARSTKLIPAENFLALTGTPMENSLTELWSIFDCILPGYLYSYPRFMKRYAAIAEQNESHPFGEELSRRVQPFILRRLKKDVLKELPPKIERQMISELTKEQKKLYLVYLEKIRSQAASELKNHGFEKSRIKILAGLTRLRQIYCHPSLFLDNYKGDSGKLIQLKDLLKEVNGSGHRVLLFSQFTSMLKIIQKVLDKENYSYFYLDGSVKSGERMRMVEEFNKGQTDIFLISLKAGGTGLNLTGADTVILYDLWWNPAVEDQAADRAHRIGQKNVVQVMRMLSMGTIEEKIFQLQQKKKELIDKVIQPGETFLSALSEQEIKGLLGL